MEKHKPIIGITLGDINGIGPELILKTFTDNNITRFCTPVIVGSSKILFKYRKLLALEEIQLNLIKSIDQVVLKKVNMLNCWEEEVQIQPGMVTNEAGKYALNSLRTAVSFLKSGNLDALVTCPINKSNIQSNDFNFIGHTEYLQKEFKANDVLMFMVSEHLKIAVASMHVPVMRIVDDITQEKIELKIKMMLHSLKHDFAISNPKIAVLGLNPHAGEEGKIGLEERDILKPAIEKFREKGDVVMGSFPADGFFGSGQYKKYDGILAMYHDQGLIPFKLLAFDNGVNFTAGLPVVRTSPDHGTAYDIAGKGIADESSFRQALFTACDILKNRQETAISLLKVK